MLSRLSAYDIVGLEITGSVIPLAAGKRGSSKTSLGVSGLRNFILRPLRWARLQCSRPCFNQKLTDTKMCLIILRLEWLTDGDNPVYLSIGKNFSYLENKCFIYLTQNFIFWIFWMQKCCMYYLSVFAPLKCKISVLLLYVTTLFNSSKDAIM